jgi:PAS domain S-box-containing protein
MSLSLSRKALILVAIPLAFEFLFIIVLAALLFSVDAERQRENHAREVTARVNSGLTALLDRFSSCVLYHVSDSPLFQKRFEGARVKIQTEITALNELVRDHPEEKMAVDKVTDLLTISVENLQRAQGQLELGNKMGAARMWMRADKDIGQLLNAIDDIVIYQQQVLAARKAAQEGYRRGVEVLLPAALLFNVLLAIGLAVYFNRGTTNRLNVLLDNTRKLALDQPLNPPLRGRDEIAALDHTFRDMASALEESRRKERAVVDNAEDVICSLDRSGTFIAVNPAVEKLWGYHPDELIGESLDFIIHKDDLQETLSAINDLVASASGTGVFENRIICADSRGVDFAWSAHWSRQEKTLFCVARDITERKQVDRMKRDFVAMVSHDLRTPLTSIQMVLSLLEAEAYGQISDSGHENLEAAEGNVNRLIALVNGLLDLEKMESGKLILQRESHRVSEVIAPSLQAVKGFAEQQGVKLSASRSDADFDIFVDRDRLVQVVINLISNAIKFSPKGGLVTLSVERHGGEKNWVKFAVTDQGRGVPDHLREVIFDRFKQVEADDAKVKGGSGLGLAICKAIVERHGGIIGVDSQEGRGSTFWFKIPA